jgi:transposase-like protein
MHDEIKAWQRRPLEACYAIAHFDALRVKIGAHRPDTPDFS